MEEYEWLVEPLQVGESASKSEIESELGLALTAVHDRIRYNTPGLGLSVNSHSLLSLGDRHFLLVLVRMR
jgi:hypothetical protein